MGLCILPISCLARGHQILESTGCTIGLLVTSKKDWCQHAFQHCCSQRPCPHSRQLTPTPPQESFTHKVGVAQSPVGSLLLSPGSWYAQDFVCVCPPRMFPWVLWKFIIKSHCPSKSDSLSSANFSLSVVSDSLWPHGLQHTRLPCPSPTPRAYSNSGPSSWWCHPTTSSSHPLLLLPSVFPRNRLFSNESVFHIRWPKHWSFSFSISPSNEHPGLISFRMDWLDLLAVQGTLKSLLQHHSSKACIIWCSAFFIIQLSHIHTWPLEKP